MAKLISETQSISLKMTKINYLILKLGSRERQLVKYSFAQCDMIEYDIEARSAGKFILLNENVSFLHNKIFCWTI